MEQPLYTRPPAVAGRFYPGTADGLAATVRALFDAVSVREQRGVQRIEHPHMLMLPHAGYVFSGLVAAKTLARVELPETLFLLGPTHTGEGAPLSVWPDGAWLTPLGALPVDAEAAACLLACGGGFQADTASHLRDHALEVLIPLLQSAAPHARIVPVTVALPDFAGLSDAAAALARAMEQLEAAGKRVCSIVSSDMSHFLSQQNAHLADHMALNELLRLNAEGLYRTVIAKRISMCGILPATLGLLTACARGASTAELVAYATSGEASGDYERVVGYAGMVIA